VINDDLDHLPGVLHRQSAQPHGVEQLKDCRIRADTERQRQNRRCRKSGVEPEETQTEL